MTRFIQETDSKIIYPSPLEVKLPLTDRLQNETSGGDLIRGYFPILIDSNRFQEAWEIVHGLHDKNVARETRKLLLSLQENLSAFCLLKFDIGYIPPLHAFIADDGSVLLEWTFRDYRVGFNIELKTEESSWFLITNKNLGEITASGYISGIDRNKIILWLLNFVLSHS